MLLSIFSSAALSVLYSVAVSAEQLDKSPLLERAANVGFCLCENGVTCQGTTPQCTVDNNQATICCASGQKAINGKCFDGGSNVCPDGKTICSGATPYCAVDVSIYADKTGAASSPTVCCAKDQKSINGKCYPRGAKLMPCYEARVCDFGKNEYCAWNAGNGYSKCCKLNEYLRGTTCVKK